MAEVWQGSVKEKQGPLGKSKGVFRKTTVPTSEPSGQRSIQEKPQIWVPGPPAAALFYPRSVEKMGPIREPLLQTPALRDGGWEFHQGSWKHGLTCFYAQCSPGSLRGDPWAAAPSQCSLAHPEQSFHSLPSPGSQDSETREIHSVQPKRQSLWGHLHFERSPKGENNAYQERLH